MSDKKIFEFHFRNIDKDFEPTKEVIESRGYKRAVKSFQIKYPKIKNALVQWLKDEKSVSKEQKLPMCRKKKIGR